MATLAPARLVRRGARDADLRAILDPGCALAIWERSLDPALARVVEGLDFDAVDDIDEILPAEQVPIRAAFLLGAAGYAMEAAVPIVGEIVQMIDCLVFVARCDRVRLRLEVVETNACRRFHADMVPMRLLVTLHGPGTQWIAADAPDLIREVPTGAVAFFKGQLLLDPPTVLHRSPPIAGTGATRLVLVIDPFPDETSA